MDRSQPQGWAVLDGMRGVSRTAEPPSSRRTMSRSYARRQHSRRYHPGVLRTFEQKAERRRAHLAVHDEAREPRASDALLEVLADFHEEHGRLQLAERLRRGRDSL